MVAQAFGASPWSQGSAAIDPNLSVKYGSMVYTDFLTASVFGLGDDISSDQEW